MSFFVKASIEALRRYPLVNASVDGNDIVYHEYYDIGVAVSTDRGLIVPIVRDADTKSFAALEKEIADYARAAREGTLAIEDLTGGTFTITNGGVFGSLMQERACRRGGVRAPVACAQGRCFLCYCPDPLNFPGACSDA